MNNVGWPGGRLVVGEHDFERARRHLGGNLIREHAGEAKAKQGCGDCGIVTGSGEAWY